MSPTAKTTLKVVYKISEDRFQISDFISRSSDVLFLTAVLSDKNIHKERTLNAQLRLAN